MPLGQGYPNLKYQPTYGVTGIAQLLAQRPMQEEQIRQMREQEKRQKLNQVLNQMMAFGQLAQQGQGIAAGFQQQAQRRQQQQAISGIGEALAGQVPGALPQGVQGPLPQGVSEQQQGLRSVAQAAPAAGAEVLLRQQFPNQFPQRQTGAVTQLNTLVTLRGQLENSKLYVEKKQHSTIDKQIRSIDQILAKSYGASGISREQNPMVAPPIPQPQSPSILQRGVQGIQNFFGGG